VKGGLTGRLRGDYLAVATLALDVDATVLVSRPVLQEAQVG